MRKTEADGQAPGLRERGKRDRLQRPQHAAAEVVRTRGYDAATTREIAQLADVSGGTVFVYARDKRGVHLVEVRRWTNAEQPDPPQGRAMLRRMFSTVLTSRLMVPGQT